MFGVFIYGPNLYWKLNQISIHISTVIDDEEEKRDTQSDNNEDTDKEE